MDNINLILTGIIALFVVLAFLYSAYGIFSSYDEKHSIALDFKLYSIVLSILMGIIILLVIGATIYSITSMGVKNKETLFMIILAIFGILAFLYSVYGILTSYNESLSWALDFKLYTIILSVMTCVLILLVVSIIIVHFVGSKSNSIKASENPIRNVRVDYGFNNKPRTFNQGVREDLDKKESVKNITIDRVEAAARSLPEIEAAARSEIEARSLTEIEGLSRSEIEAAAADEAKRLVNLRLMNETISRNAKIENDFRRIKNIKDDAYKILLDVNEKETNYREIYDSLSEDISIFSQYLTGVDKKNMNELKDEAYSFIEKINKLVDEFMSKSKEINNLVKGFMSKSKEIKSLNALDKIESLYKDINRIRETIQISGKEIVKHRNTLNLLIRRKPTY